MSRPVEDFVEGRLEATDFWRAAAIAVTKPERLEALILYAATGDMSQVAELIGLTRQGATDRVRLALASIRDHLEER